MATLKMVQVQTKWTGLWGDKIRCGSSEKDPTGTLYDVSKDGEAEVSEEHARELCSTSGWRRKPQPQQAAPQALAGRRPLAKRSEPEAAEPAPAAEKAEDGGQALAVEAEQK